MLKPLPHSHLQCFKIPSGMLTQSRVTISQVWKLPPLLVSANESPAPSHLPLRLLVTRSVVTQLAKIMLITAQDHLATSCVNSTCPSSNTVIDF